MSIKVVCIDDDPIALLIIETILRRTSFTKDITAFNEAKQAISYLHHYKNLPFEKIPKIIFLDLNMPVMNGWDFLDAFQEDFPEWIGVIKILILSSSINPEDERKALEHACVTEYITKPASHDLMEELKAKYLSI